MRTGRDQVREWLDGLDKLLAAESCRASQAHQPTMTGDHREEAFRAALREFLPPVLGIETGKVFAIDGAMSKQIDVVIHDGRYPKFKVGESALFPVESVLATIEVKSRLTREELSDAWQKCTSVAMLPVSIAEQAQVQEESDPDRRVRILADHLSAPSYIFAFDGFKTLEVMGDALAEIGRTCGFLRSPYQERPLIPSVIVSGGGVVSMAWGAPVRVRPGADEPALPNDQEPLFVNVNSPNGFGLLAAHLLWTVERRLAAARVWGGMCRSVIEYLPFEEYLEAPLAGHYAVTMVPKGGDVHV